MRQVEWKLTRGKWRPKLLDYAKAHSEDSVRGASSLAFKSMEEEDAAEGTKGLKEAISALTELKVMLTVLLCSYALTLSQCRI